MADTVPLDRLDRQVVIGDDALPGEARLIEAAERALSGERRGVRAVLPFLGPAFIAAVAYIDPGNFATNMAGGSQFGYTLLWVVLAANLMAMLVQSMSAKLGIATGRSLPEVCRDRLPFRVVVLLWLQAEAIAMATDLAEFVGAALGLHLVFGLSLWISALLTGLAAFVILGMQVWGFRRLEATITGLVAVVVLAFGLEVLKSGPSAAGVAHGTFVPQFSGSGSALLAVGIVGATVMPHVIYLHSSLTQKRIVGRQPGRAPQDLPLRDRRCHHRDGDRRRHQPGHAGHGGRGLPHARDVRRRQRPGPGLRWPEPVPGRAQRDWSSASPCSRPGSRRPASAPCPVRW